MDQKLLSAEPFGGKIRILLLGSSQTKLIFSRKTLDLKYINMSPTQECKAPAQLYKLAEANMLKKQLPIFRIS
jgi:hypothetical protein